MELKEILAVSGKSGLFKIISHTKTGLIAENMSDGKRIPVYASDKISNLAEISVYSEDKEIPLKEIFKAIYDKESGAKITDAKTEESKLKEYFAEAVPAYDRQRVYISDIKKILSWYNILHDNNMLAFTEKTEEVEETAEATDDDTTAEEIKETIADEQTDVATPENTVNT
jgi:hypothetical protein